MTNRIQRTKVTNALMIRGIYELYTSDILRLKPLVIARVLPTTLFKYEAVVLVNTGMHLLKSKYSHGMVISVVVRHYDV